MDRYIVQTPVMAERLGRRYAIPEERIHVVAQPAPTRAEVGDLAADSRIAACPKPHRLLFLAVGYPHKNHAVLENVVCELSRRGLSRKVQIFVTLDPHEVSPGLAEVLRRHRDVVTNLMRLPYTEVGGALNASTALFLPSFAESYGLVYVEALAAGLPILTSDRDFARWMCGDLAVYFDPLNASSIVDALEAYPRMLARGADFELRAAERLQRFPRAWSDVAATFLAITAG
ncbi:MAG TPA: glycosyltransferase, partial [Thermoanaerobaculia bacterium]